MDNNIHAFPNEDFGNKGMTLLDYFAAKVLQGISSTEDIVDYDDKDNGSVVSQCYNLASLMLEERKKYIQQ